MHLLSQETPTAVKQQFLYANRPHRCLRIVREQRRRYDGELQAAQRHLVAIVDARFPTLRSLAYQRVLSLQQVEALNALAAQLTNAPDELGARYILSFISPL